MARALGTGGRFFLAYLLLGALVGTGVGLFIVLLERKGPAHWSSWHPESSSTVGLAQEIATHVASGYRLPSGQELARVRIPPAQTESSLRAIGIPLTASPKNLADFRRFERDRSMMYALCGPDRNCRISERTAREHQVALRREALELALYTFKYSRPIQNVAVFFPPGPKQTGPNAALFFHRADLARQLRLPLASTLSRPRPPLVGGVDPAEKSTVEQLTISRLYRYQGIAKAGDFGDILVLSPVG
ncbi:MAG TPA: hypothetical protein VGJ27_07065 [Gaiellaceae bacterium]|jgi:hypothetical protein